MRKDLGISRTSDGVPRRVFCRVFSSHVRRDALAGVVAPLNQNNPVTGASGSNLPEWNAGRNRAAQSGEPNDGGAISTGRTDPGLRVGSRSHMRPPSRSSRDASPETGGVEMPSSKSKPPDLHALKKRVHRAADDGKSIA
jgi:hypothetical protein